LAVLDVVVGRQTAGETIDLGLAGVGLTLLLRNFLLLLLLLGL